MLQANAARLARDAKLLLESGRFPSAAMMAVMALEEISRVFHPIEILTAGSDRQRQQAWKTFRGIWHAFPWAVFARDERLMSDAELDAMLSFIRMLGRRSECIEPGIWIDPGELITAALAASIVTIAESFCAKPISLGSVEVWMELAKSLPANISTRASMRKFQAALESKGLMAEASMVAHINQHYDSIRERLGPVPKR